MLGWHRKNVDTPILLVTYVSSCSCSHYAHIGVTQAIDAEELRNRHWAGRKRSATSERCGVSARPPLVSTTKAPAIPGFVAQSHGLGTRRLRFTVVTSFHGTMGLLSRPMLHGEKSVTYVSERAPPMSPVETTGVPGGPWGSCPPWGTIATTA